MAKLTERGIKTAKYRGGWDVRWDGGTGGVTGLGLRIYPSGRRAFVISYRAGGRKRLMVLDDLGTITLTQARNRAKRELAKVSEGKDPAADRRKAKQGETLRDLERAFIERHVRPKHLKTASDIERRLERNTPKSWLSRLARDISGREIAAHHAKLGETAPYSANRWLENIRTMYRLAPLWEFVPKGHVNPTTGIDKHPETKRKRWLTQAEMPALAAAIDGEANIYARAAIWLYMLTGARRTELLRAKWADVDLDRGTLRLPETKSGEEQFIPLSSFALALLQAIPRQEKNPYVFCGAKQGRHLVNIYKAWYQIRKRATVALWGASDDTASLIAGLREGLGREPTVAECKAGAKREGVELPTGLIDLRIHDLRRTVGSWMTQSGVELNTIREGLRHADVSTTLTYARLGADPAREAFEAHGKRIMDIAGKRGPRVVTGGNGD